MKRIALLIILTLLAPAAISDQPHYRLASVTIDRFSYSYIEGAQMYSVFGDWDGEQVFDSWRFWDNQSLYVSGLWYNPGETLVRIYTADGYYCTTDQVTVPDYAFELRIIELPPARLVRRVTDYTVELIAADSSTIDIIFEVNDYDSSFGAFNALYNEDELAEGPAVVVGVPVEDWMNIWFEKYPTRIMLGNWVYWVFDFPIVYYNVDLTGGVAAIVLDYDLFEPVNLSISLIDGWSRHAAIELGECFPLPEEPTLFVDFYNQTQIGEPLVWFMPQVELDTYGDWAEPSYYDAHPPPYTRPESKTREYVILAGIVFFVLVLAVIIHVKEG